MRESDPKPMPPAVKAAYRQPVDLLGLLKSEAYGDADRKRVRDDLLEALAGDMGVVHLPHGAKQTRTATQRARSIKDPVRSIGFVLAIEDYGGEERMLPYLARAMEPRWRQWWNSMNWQKWEDVRQFGEVSQHLLGHRQFVWLAAQDARAAFGYGADTKAALRAIEAAEAWAMSPTENNRKLALKMSNLAYDTANASGGNVNATYAAADAAAGASQANIETAAYAAADTVGYAQLCELTKQLITPSLLDAR